MIKLNRKISLLLAFTIVLSGIIAPGSTKKVHAAGGTALLKDLPEGTTVYDPGWKWQHKPGVMYSDENIYFDYVGNGQYKSITWVVAAHNHYATPLKSVTLMTEELIAKYPYHSTKEITSWSSSSLRTWLNGTFYNGLGAGFKTQVLTTTVPNINFNSFNKPAGSVSNTSDKIFIPSETELGGPATGAYKVGVKMDYFNTAAKRAAKLGGSSQSYWVRTPLNSVDFYMRYALSSGGFDAVSPVEGSRMSGASMEVGVRPMLNMNPDTIVYADASDYVAGGLVLGGLPAGFDKGEFFPEPPQPDDIIPPTGEVTQSTTEWTNQDVDLYVKADDETSLKSITLPTGEVIVNKDAQEGLTGVRTYDFPQPIKVQSSETTRNGIFPKNKTIQDYGFTSYNQDVQNSGYSLTNQYFVNWKFGYYGLDLKGPSSARLWSGSSDVNWVPVINRNSRIIEEISDENYIFVGQYYKFIYSDEVINNLIRYEIKTGKIDKFVINAEGVQTNDSSRYFSRDGYNYIIGNGEVFYFKPNETQIQKIKLRNEERYSYGKAATTEEGDKIIVFEARSGYLPQSDFEVFNTETNKPQIIQYIDTTPPTMTLTVDSTGETIGGVNITVTAEDTSGIKKITLPDGTVVENTTEIYNATTNGIHEFKVEDNRGNIAVLSYKVGNVVSTEELDIKIEGNLSEPASQVKLEVQVKDQKSQVASIKVNGEVAGFTYVVTENGTYNYSIVDSAGRETNKSVVVTNIDKTLEPKSLSVVYTVSANGEYLFRAHDVEGNETVFGHTVNNIDKVKPTVKLEKNEDGQITVDADDDLSGVAKVYYSVDGDVWTEDESILKETPTGSYTLYVKVEDKAGNISEIETIEIEIEEEFVLPEEETPEVIEPSEPTTPEESDGAEKEETDGEIDIKYVDEDGLEISEMDRVNVPIDIEIMVQAKSIKGYAIGGEAQVNYTLTEEEPKQEHTFAYVEVDEPEVPEEPTDPETPVEPEEPTAPETPVEPEKPTDPETPVVPEKPVDPVVPETPTVPGNGGGSSGNGGIGGSRPETEEEALRNKIKNMTVDQLIEYKKELVKDIPYTLLVGTKLNWAKTLGIKSELFKIKFDENKLGLQELEITLPGLVVKEKINVIGLEAKTEVINNIPNGHWAKDSVIYTVGKGYIVGTDKGQLNLNNIVKVEDSFTGYDRLLLSNGITEMISTRTEVENKLYKITGWAEYSVKSILSKVSSNRLESYKNTQLDIGMKREDVAEMIYRTLGNKIKTDKSRSLNYLDMDEVTKVEAVEFCTKIGVLFGTDQGLVKPQDYVTRAEYMAILERTDKILAELSK